MISNLGLIHTTTEGDYSASSEAIMQTIVSDLDVNLSVANYANMDTLLSTMNISSGSLSVYKDGTKANIIIDTNETLGQLRQQINNEFSGNVDITIDSNGHLKFFSNDGSDVQVGSSIDTSNISAICGFLQNDDGTVISAKELYKVNANSKITAEGIFRNGNVNEGSFILGDQEFNITDDTTIASLVSQINSSDKANATAYWDSIDGKLVITSRSTGAALINIEAGDSNFTDILGLTRESSKLVREAQEMGQNSKFSINGTTFTSTSNTITSDVSRIDGLTINLKGTGKTTTITVGQDTEAVSDAVQEFVDAYNELIESVDEEVSKDGNLSDQYTLKSIRNQIKNLLVNSYSGGSVFRNLSAIGISTNAATGASISTSGLDNLYFDKDKFIEQYSKEPEALKSMFIGTEETPGILMRVETIVENALATQSGYFSSAEKSYASKIQTLNDKISRANKAVEAYRARLEAKFKSMDMLIAQMQQQYSSFLTQGSGTSSN